MKYGIKYDQEEGMILADILETFDEEAGAGFLDTLKDEFTEEQRRYMLAYMAEEAQPLPDKNTRRLLRTKINEVPLGKVAIYGAKPGLRMVAKIILAAVGKGSDAKFFTSREEAFSWLKEQQKLESGE